MSWIKIKEALRKIIPPSRRMFEDRTDALVALFKGQECVLIKEISILRAESSALRQEIAGLREKDIAGLADQIGLAAAQQDFYCRHLCKKELEETIRNEIIPLRFYRNVDETRRNWGDDLNIYLVEALSGRKVKIIRTSDKENTDFNILSIGSICSELNWGSIIWGAGLINKEFELPARPVEVRAVRGPLTRKMLLEKGIECPAVYGDPALLLPLFYHPAKKKHNRMTIVAHYVDADSEVVAQYSHLKDVHMVDMGHYDDWRDVIDAIANSDFVISSSLHGLIVAEAYGIPSLWVEFSDKILGRWFKYIDFYESIGKKNMKPVRINKGQDLASLMQFKTQWSQGSVNVKPLIESCPFPIVNAIPNRTQKLQKA